MVNWLLNKSLLAMYHFLNLLIFKMFILYSAFWVANELFSYDIS